MNAKPRENVKLTEPEGRLLALIVRQQPATAYQLYKLHEQSPASSINSSKGQVYPAIQRLKDRGLIKARAVRGDRRNTEELSVTPRGLEAARQWAKAVEPSLVNVDDPLRTRVLSFDLLSREEKLEWVANAKAAVKAVAERFEAYRSVEVPYQDLMYKNASELLRAKMNWLDEVLYEVAGSE